MIRMRTFALLPIQRCSKSYISAMLVILLLLLPAFLLSIRWLRSDLEHLQDAVDLLLQQEPLRDQSVLISRQLHQSWKTDRLPSQRASRWAASWRRCFPGWRWRLWTDDDNLRLVRRHYPWLMSTFLALKRPVERADIVRYLYMHRYGGIYADLDTLCVRNFTRLLGSAAIILGGMDHTEARPHETILGTYVQNSLLASRPGHPFWLRLVLRARRETQRLLANVGATGDVRPEYTTGPLLLMKELRECIGRDSSQREDGAIVSGDLLILPGRYLNPFSWSVNENQNCKDLGNMTLPEELLCVASFPQAYVVQFHTQSWLGGHL